MSEYDDLLKECASLGRYVTARLKVTVPKMFNALLKEGETKWPNS